VRKPGQQQKTGCGGKRTNQGVDSRGPDEFPGNHTAGNPGRDLTPFLIDAGNKINVFAYFCCTSEKSIHLQVRRHQMYAKKTEWKTDT
jgi:hypothetical protein